MLRAAGIPSQRGWQAHDPTREPDVSCPGFWPECKCGAAISVPAAMRQATEAAQGRGVPVVLAKWDRQLPVAVMPLAAWIDLVRAVQAGRVT